MSNFLILCITFCGGYITGVAVTFVLEWMYERKALKDFERESNYYRRPDYTVRAEAAEKLKKAIDKHTGKNKLKPVKADKFWEKIDAVLDQTE